CSMPTTLVSRTARKRTLSSMCCVDVPTEMPASAMTRSGTPKRPMKSAAAARNAPSSRTSPAYTAHRAGANAAATRWSASRRRANEAVSADAIRRSDELAVHDHRRHRLDVVLLRENQRALELAVHAERTVDLGRLGAIQPFACNPVEKRFVLIQGHTRTVDAL